MPRRDELGEGETFIQTTHTPLSTVQQPIRTTPYPGTLAQYNALPFSVKQYYSPPVVVPAGYQVARETTLPVYSEPTPSTASPLPASPFQPKEQVGTMNVVELEPIPKPLSIGEIAYRGVELTERLITELSGQQQSDIGKAIIRAELMPAYGAAGVAGTLESDVVGALSIPTSIYESARTGQLQYKQAIDVQLSPTTIGAVINPSEAQRMSERPLAYNIGAGLGEASFLTLTSVASGKVISKVVTPKVEDWLAKSYKESADAFKLWEPSTTQKVAMKLFGARPPRLAAQIVSMPRDVGLDVFEFSISPRSSALLTPLPKAPTFAQQIVSIPFATKTMAIAGGKSFEYIGKNMMEAQDFAWDLMQTPKSSGIMLWKNPVTEPTTHYLTLISRHGYTTIGTFMWDKPFIEGLLSAPAGTVLTTFTTQTLKSRMPYYPEATIVSRSTGRTAQILVPFSEYARPSGILGLPLFTPTVPSSSGKKITRTVISPITTPHLFPETPTRQQERQFTVPTVIPIQQPKSSESLISVTVPKISTPTLPDIPIPNVPKSEIPTPKITTPTIPNIPTIEVPKGSTPLFPRGGGSGESKRNRNPFGFWYPRKHKVKTWQQQLKTFGLGKGLKGIGKLDMRKTSNKASSLAGIVTGHSKSYNRKRTNKHGRRKKR